MAIGMLRIAGPAVSSCLPSRSSRSGPTRAVAPARTTSSCSSWSRGDPCPGLARRPPTAFGRAWRCSRTASG
eukprot:8657046-Alexandrium_andersonii.AAC.1